MRRMSSLFIATILIFTSMSAWGIENDRLAQQPADRETLNLAPSPIITANQVVVPDSATRSMTAAPTATIPPPRRRAVAPGTVLKPYDFKAGVEYVPSTGAYSAVPGPLAAG